MMAHLFSHARKKGEESDEELGEKPKGEVETDGGKLTLNEAGTARGDLPFSGETKAEVKTKNGGNRRRVEVIIVKNEEECEVENNPKDESIVKAEVKGKNGGRRRRDAEVDGEENGRKVETDKNGRDLKVKKKKSSKGRPRETEVDRGKRVLNETGNIQNNSENSGKGGGEVNEMSDERRRSQRAKPRLSYYYEGCSDEHGEI